jgi:hypothetical protein
MPRILSDLLKKHGPDAENILLTEWSRAGALQIQICKAESWEEEAQYSTRLPFTLLTRSCSISFLFIRSGV